MSQAHELSLLFWNIWGHRKPKELETSLKEFANSGVDVFCLTEVTDTPHEADKGRVVHTSTTRREPPSRLNGLDRLESVLAPEFNLRYDTRDRNDWWCFRQRCSFKDVGFGSVIAWRRRLHIQAIGTFKIAPDPFAAKPRILQWTVFKMTTGRYLIAHLHGLWLEENSKGDHPLRLAQSKEVSERLERLRKTFDTDKVIFGGDLNLDIGTEALSLLKFGTDGTKPMRNLVEELSVESTRTPLYRRWSDLQASQHADHIFVTPEVKVHDLDQEGGEDASDHTPMLVKIS